MHHSESIPKLVYNQRSGFSLVQSVQYTYWLVRC